jgi:Calcineurin-like phosphoesterase
VYKNEEVLVTKARAKRKTLAVILIVAMIICAVAGVMINKFILDGERMQFSIIQITDTQFLSAHNSTMFDALTNWIQNQSLNLNLKMVVHTGDIVDSRNDAVQWQSANNAMNILYNNDVSYQWVAGNHDNMTLGSTYPAFNTSLMARKSYWTSSYGNGGNTAVRFSFDGHNFLVVGLEYLASSGAISWMTNLFSTYQSENIIVTTHCYLNSTAGYGIWPSEHPWVDNLRTTLDSYPHVFLVLSGHDDTAAHGANMTNVNGREEIFFNYQSADMRTTWDGAATVRIYTFTLGNPTTIAVTTFEVSNSTWVTDQWNQFSFKVNLK